MDEQVGPGTASGSFQQVRIWLYGPFQMQWRDPMNCEDGPFADASLVGRDGAAAISLLALLLSQPGRQAHRDWIMEQFWPEGRRDVAVHRLENIFSCLRKLLRPPWGGESLLSSSGGKKGSGPSYSLEAYPKIWVDLDAVTWQVEQGARLERFGENAFPFWERAFALLTRGPFLADHAYDAYAEWLMERREQQEGTLRQCVHALAHCYVTQRGAASKNEALLVLRTYWQQNKTDEDALRPLMELLGEQERYQEAEQYYRQLEAALAEGESDSEGRARKPDPRTHDIYEYLRYKQIRREQGQTISTKAVENTYAVPGDQKLLPTSRSAPDSMRQELPLLSINPTDTSLSRSSFAFFHSDLDVLTQLSTILSKPSVVAEREVTYFDHQTRLYWYAREEATLSATTLYGYVIRHIHDMNTLLMRSLAPMLRTFLCEVICQTVLLAGILLYDMGQYQRARQHYQVAWKAANEANNLVFQAIVWGWMSFTWTYTKCYTEALFYVQQAYYFASQTSNSILQAWLGAVEAEIQANLHNHDACLQSLKSIDRSSGASSCDVAYLFEFNPTLLLGYKGICLQQLYHKAEPQTHRFLQEAKESLELALAGKVPIKRKLYYLSDLAGAHARQGEVEAACAYVVQSLHLLTQESRSKTLYKHLLQAFTLLQPHEHLPSVQALHEQMRILMSDAQA